VLESSRFLGDCEKGCSKGMGSTMLGADGSRVSDPASMSGLQARITYGSLFHFFAILLDHARHLEVLIIKISKASE
jgi:hypothetical protein